MMTVVVGSSGSSRSRKSFAVLAIELSTAAQPTYANPTAQGVVAILALVANVICLTAIIKRSVEQKKNPYKNDIFTDQKDYKIAMARVDK